MFNNASLNMGTWFGLTCASSTSQSKSCSNVINMGTDAKTLLITSNVYNYNISFLITRTNWRDFCME